MNEKVRVVLDDGTPLEGQSLGMKKIKMKLEIEKLHDPITFDLTDVKAIKPSVEPAVRISARVTAGLVYERGQRYQDNHLLLCSYLLR